MSSTALVSTPSTGSIALLHAFLRPRFRGGRPLDVAFGERQERRPVGAGGVPAPVLPESELAIKEAGLHGREFRSEERRVGKECRSRWSAYHSKKKRRARENDTTADEREDHTE